jgi:hypothetical protein
MKPTVRLAGGSDRLMAGVAAKKITPPGAFRHIGRGASTSITYQARLPCQGAVIPLRFTAGCGVSQRCDRHEQSLVIDGGRAIASTL